MFLSFRERAFPFSLCVLYGFSTLSLQQALLCWYLTSSLNLSRCTVYSVLWIGPVFCFGLGWIWWHMHLIRVSSLAFFLVKTRKMKGDIPINDNKIMKIQTFDGKFLLRKVLYFFRSPQSYQLLIDLISSSWNFSQSKWKILCEMESICLCIHILLRHPTLTFIKASDLHSLSLCSKWAIIVFDMYVVTSHACSLITEWVTHHKTNCVCW